MPCTNMLSSVTFSLVLKLWTCKAFCLLYYSCHVMNAIPAQHCNCNCQVVQCIDQRPVCVCRQDEPASCLYVLISGRIRLIREDPGMRPRVRVEEEVGRGEAVGAVWALTGGIHDTTALCVRDSELVRMSKVESLSNSCCLCFMF